MWPSHKETWVLSTEGWGQGAWAGHGCFLVPVKGRRRGSPGPPLGVDAASAPPGNWSQVGCIDTLGCCLWVLSGCLSRHLPQASCLSPPREPPVPLVAQGARAGVCTRPSPALHGVLAATAQTGMGPRGTAGTGTPSCSRGCFCWRLCVKAPLGWDATWPPAAGLGDLHVGPGAGSPTPWRPGLTAWPLAAAPRAPRASRSGLCWADSVLGKPPTSAV